MLYVNSHGAVLWGVLEGVRQDVGQYFFQFVLVVKGLIEFVWKSCIKADVVSLG